MRVTVVIHSLGAGGAQRVATILANAWAARGDEVTIVTFTDRSSPFYPLDPRVLHREIGEAVTSTRALRRFTNNAVRVWRLRQALRRSRPACIVSFIDQVNVISSLAVVGLGSRLVVTERIDPSMAPISRAWKRLRDWTYPLADGIVMQTRAAAAALPARARPRATVIPNPVRPVTTGAAPRLPSARRLVLGIGRLVPQKGFDLLIDAFAGVAAEFPGWDLTILGEGPSRAELEDAVAQLGLSGRIRMPGVVSDVAAYLGGTDLFVLPPRFEGFPNVLCEAMSSAVACIASDCRSGPAEIVRPGIDGLLVPVNSVPALTEAMRRLMSDEAERARLGARAKEVIDRYGLSSILDAWDAVIRLRPSRSR